jgi:hypothetical protein
MLTIISAESKQKQKETKKEGSLQGWPGLLSSKQKPRGKCRGEKKGEPGVVRLSSSKKWILCLGQSPGLGRCRSLTSNA